MKSSKDADTTQATIIRSASWKEKERARLNDILDYDLANLDKDNKGLKSITALASIICKTKMSCITLVGSTYVNFLSTVNCFITGIERDKSFCNLAIEQDDFFEICDSSKDERYCKEIDTPIKYYGVYPLKSFNGYYLGNLCVCDFNPNKLDASQILALKTLAEQVMVHLELRKQNIKLKEALERAEKLSKVKDDFVSNMSHELRTPLNAINGFIDILSKSKLDADQKEAVSIIMSSCDILLTLINDILDISNLESAKLDIDKSPFNIRKAMKNIKDLLNTKAEVKNIELNLIIDERVPKNILGDKIRISQIIMNLIGNSIKFTGKGSVTLTVNLKEETPSQVILDFSINDTGIGIPADKLDLIFDRFKQVGMEITKKYGGTGLGLSITKKLVELHHGELKVRSVFGTGAEFYFTIAYDKVNEVESLKKNLHSFNYSNLEILKNLKVLICEDNVVNIKLIKNLFKNKQTLIEVAENGKIAIEILNRRKDFDVIIMDINMPEMNGIETTKFIRNTMKLTLPIIGFTANLSKSERDLCLQIGMNDYITKTFKSEEFFQSLSLSLAMKYKKVYQEDSLENIERSKIRSYSYEIGVLNNVDEHFAIKNVNSKRASIFSFFKNETNAYKLNSSTVLLSEAKNFIYKDKNACKDKTFLRKSSFIPGANISSADSKNNQLVNLNCFNNKFSSSDSSEVDEEFEIFRSLKVISCDDKEFEKELIEIFLKEFPIEMDNLESAIKLKNFEAIKFLVHKMKSPLDMLGLNNLKEKIINLESIFYKEDHAVIIKKYNSLKDQAESNYSLFNNYLEKLSFV